MATSAGSLQPLGASSAQPIVTGNDYIQSLRGRNLRVYFMGERVAEPVDHPVIRPSINALARTYDLAVENPELATAWSNLSHRRVNRFLHVTENAADVVAQNRMQRRLGQLTGTCFQRCVGMDAINSMYSVSYEMDETRGTAYHAPLQGFHRPHAGDELRDRRRHDRSQGRPQ